MMISYSLVRRKDMVKILQFGQGNFLRAFVDFYFDTLNKENLGEYQIYIVKPRPLGDLDKFRLQNCKYHLVTRGIKNSKKIEKVDKIDCVKDAINPFIDYEKYMSLATDENLKIIISNTTETGIRFNGNDCPNNFENISFPAKLTLFLFERFKSGLNGVYILPTELIDKNADVLKGFVNDYAGLWNLPEEFIRWNDQQNYYCNTLVDKIVSGYPKDIKTLSYIENLIGEKDQLAVVGEPFGLWAIENKGELFRYVREGEHGIQVLLVNDIEYYKRRKVRVLNGSHTNVVSLGLMLGAHTIYDCMCDKRISEFIDNALIEEIIPFVSNDIKTTSEFANTVKSRFLNPFLDHKLNNILLYSISKWKARLLPSFKDYYCKNGKIPPRLTIGFSYLMALYSSIEVCEKGYVARFLKQEIELKDEPDYLDFFASKKPLKDFMRNLDVWGEDLTVYKGFYEQVMDNVKKINQGQSLI